MKIGKLTVPFNNNYGGYLQAFALMTVLKDMGHEPVIIMRRHNERSVNLVLRAKYFLKGIVHSFQTRRLCPLVYGKEKDYSYLGMFMHHFVEKWIQPQTPFLYSTDELRTYCKDKFDAYVVGSDQVWRAIYVPEIENYFLNFTIGWPVKRFSYAASFGTLMPEYNQQEIANCGCLIKHFDSISVRERKSIEVFSRFRWKVNNVQYVVDPTLLLGADEYKRIIPQKDNCCTNKVFYYILDNNDKIQKMLDYIGEKLNLPISGISNIQKKYKPLPSVEFWLSEINNSDFIVTDSFHGMVFSIIFNKPFVVLLNNGRGSERFESFLSELSLADRVCNDFDAIDQILHKRINWDIVNSTINSLRVQSLSFLKKIK